MTLVAVAPRFKIAGFDGRREKVPRAFEVLHLHDALTRTYTSDAHLVAYVVPGAERQPRINKPGLPYWPEPTPEIGVFFADLDNTPHVEWTNEKRDAAIARYESSDILQTAGIYHTKKGARVVQPIVRPIPVTEVEPYIARWHAQLWEAGLEPDKACKDWTRLFRLPNVFRDGEQFRTPYLNLARMRPIALEPLWEPAPEPAIKSAPRSPAAPIRVDWRRDVPEDWRDQIQPIADSVRSVQSEWHSLFMALSGALLRHRVAPKVLPAMVGAISAATGADTRSEDRVAAARSTVESYLADLPITGYGTLAREWPAVAEAVDAVFESEPALQASPPPLVTSQADLKAAIRDAPDGLTLIAAECGLGKTAAALEVATDRAAKEHSSQNAEGSRAPLGSKTAISVDKHELAMQIVADLDARGVQAQRFFGPLSLKNPDGTPVCKLHGVAQHLVSGGQPMQWELCQGRDIDPCPHRDTCPARDGVEGPEDARVSVGPHQLIGALDREAGTTGLLVIDEPPDLLDLVPIRPKELERTVEHLHAFDADFASALAPALEALIAWTEHIGPLGQCIPIREAIEQGADAIDPATMTCAMRACQFEGSAVEYAAAAQPDERTGKAPPIRYMNLTRARENEAYARKLGSASGVLRSLYNAITSEAPSSVVLDKDRRGRCFLVVITVREQLAQSLRREGAVVAMDANIAVNAPIFAKAVGYDPPLHGFAGADGVPVRRLQIRRKSAARKYWLPHGKLKLVTGLVQSVKDILEFAEGTQSLGIITMRTIELALRAALEPDNPQLDNLWHDAHQDPKTLAEAREKLGPILQAYPGTIAFGHYGAVRGLNHMKNVDCLATLGDPWPNLNRVRYEVMFLGLDDSWQSRTVDLCKAELEQAHGRLRAIHRTGPTRAVHVGSVRPSGWGWTRGDVEVQEVKRGRRPKPTTMSTEEFSDIVTQLGGVRAAARAIGRAKSTISDLKTGKKRVSSAVSAIARNLVKPQSCTDGNVAQQCPPECIEEKRVL